MITKKPVSLIAITFLLICFILPHVNATGSITIAANTVTSNASSGIKVEHPSATGNISAVGAVFQAEATGYLTEIKVTSIDNGAYNRNGTFICRLYTVTGTYGSTAKPSLQILSSTNEIYVNAAGVYYFNFSGTYQITIGLQYAFAIECTSMDAVSYSTYVTFKESSTDTYTGNSFIYSDSAWSVYDPTFDLEFTVYGEASPQSTSPISTDDLPDLYNSFVNFLVPVLVMTLPAMLLWWLGGRGKWPLLIGLAIGTGLGYVFIAGFPLWLVFLVAIGIIGMAYSDVSGGGAYT